MISNVYRIGGNALVFARIWKSILPRVTTNVFLIALAVYIIISVHDGMHWIWVLDKEDEDIMQPRSAALSGLSQVSNSYMTSPGTEADMAKYGPPVFRTERHT